MWWWSSLDDAAAAADHIHFHSFVREICINLYEINKQHLIIYLHAVNIYTNLNIWRLSIGATMYDNILNEHTNIKLIIIDKNDFSLFFSFKSSWDSHNNFFFHIFSPRSRYFTFFTIQLVTRKIKKRTNYSKFSLRKKNTDTRFYGIDRDWYRNIFTKQSTMIRWYFSFHVHSLGAHKCDCGRNEHRYVR